MRGTSWGLSLNLSFDLDTLFVGAFRLLLSRSPSSPHFRCAQHNTINSVVAGGANKSGPVAATATVTVEANSSGKLEVMLRKLTLSPTTEG